MSRIGKQPIEIPNGVTVSVNDNVVTVKGSQGELVFDYGYEVTVEANDKEVVVKQKGKGKFAHSMWGTTRSLIQNMIEGVTNGFKKTLELNGVGYKMAVQGKKLVLNLGFSHPVELEIPEGLKAEIDNEKLTISGIDKQAVGQFAAEVRSLRKVEPYKGKGFRYEGEQFIKKEGKKAVGTE